jgi:exodeoxyribonuclease-5
MPDIMLTKVHRQAAENPIIRLSMRVRTGLSPLLGSYGDSHVIGRCGIDPQIVVNADQVLVGKNVTRHASNARIRQLKGFDDPLPMINDKLVCLRNDRDKGLLNGGLWRVTSVDAAPEGLPKLPADFFTDGTIATTIARGLGLEVISTDEPDGPVTISADSAVFTSGEDLRDNGFDDFNFGYALTVHKSQGSQWNNVVLFDESSSFRDKAARWLYTGITRAAERITIVK